MFRFAFMLACKSMHRHNQLMYGPQCALVPMLQGPTNTRQADANFTSHLSSLLSRNLTLKKYELGYIGFFIF